MAKEGYKPTSGMQSAARRAIKLKEQGKAKGAGTMVGWTRAGQLARGETLSLSTVKRMYSFFSRHEVDKKGKNFNNAENPSNGKIMWLAWGGDAGFSWSRKIVNREKNMKKSIQMQETIEEIKSILEDVINPIDTVVEVSDDVLEKSQNLSDEEIEKRKQSSKANWDNLSVEAKEHMQKSANAAIRISSKIGSKLEKFLYVKLINDGFKVEFHKENTLANTKLQIDMFIPSINTAIEIDGPSHFEPVWGQDALSKNITYDQKKEGLIFGRGWSLIRIKQTKDFSKARSNLIYSKLAEFISINSKILKSGQQKMEIHD